jgi:hypothetical protein
MAQLGRLLMLMLALLIAAATSMVEAVDPWLTRPEVAKRIRVPEKTLAQWGSQRKGPKYARFGRHCRYRLSDVIAWENAQFGGDDAA